MICKSTKVRPKVPATMTGTIHTVKAPVLSHPCVKVKFVVQVICTCSLFTRRYPYTVLQFMGIFSMWVSSGQWLKEFCGPTIH